MASAIPVPEQPGRLYLVPPAADPSGVVWTTPEGHVTPEMAKTVNWLANVHTWGMLLGVPVLLMTLAYWGTPRGPTFNLR